MPGSMGKKGGGVRGTTTRAGSAAVANSRGSRAVNGAKNTSGPPRKGSPLAGRSGGINGPTSTGGG